MEQLAAKIHKSGFQGVIAITGGGVGAYNLLCRYGGASKTFIEGIIPYATESFEDHVKGSPEKWVSGESVRQLAMAAYQRARFLKKSSNNLFGVASSASLIKNEDEREGRTHRVAIAIHTDRMTNVVEYTVDLAKRHEQEDTVSALVLNTIAKAVGVYPMDIDAGRYLGCKIVKQQTEYAKGEWPKLFFKELFACYGDGTPVAKEEVKAIFPGSFNYRHTGHQDIERVGSSKLGVKVHYEISVLNVDKPALDYISISDRLSKFDDLRSVILTNAAKITEKTTLFPGATVLVGIDTWSRIINPKYYDDNILKMQAGLEMIALRGCGFLVFGRLVDGTFKTLTKDGTIPASLRVEAIEETDFRRDISSSELRKAAASVGV